MNQIAIVGLGYVGLPLALQFARSGARVLGLDIDSKKTEAILAGKTYIKHVSADDISARTGSGNLDASTNFSRVSEMDAVILCVPTLLNHFREPDLSYVLDTGREIAPHLKKGALIVLESTTYPGTTDTDLLRVLEEGSGKKAGVDFHLAFSPEREDPGNPDSKVASIPKVIGGLTPTCLEKAMELYSIAIGTLVPVASCRVAEATKLLENIFRSVNIALVNELKVVYGAMDIDIWEVIEKFEALGGEVSYHDPFVPVIPMTREHAEYAGRKAVPEITPDYDLIVLSTGHDEYKSHDFSGYDMPLVDTRNAVSPSRRPGKYYQA